MKLGGVAALLAAAVIGRVRATCPAVGCEVGAVCAANEDCRSGFCGFGLCLVPSCVDGFLNQNETGVDCGGECPACPVGFPCWTGFDCDSGVCDGAGSARVCARATCSDGIRNGEEADVDCGRACGRPCNDGLLCTVRSDCASARCLPSERGERTTVCEPVYSSPLPSWAAAGVFLRGVRKATFRASAFREALALLLDVPAASVFLARLTDHALPPVVGDVGGPASTADFITGLEVHFDVYAESFEIQLVLDRIGRLLDLFLDESDPSFPFRRFLEPEGAGADFQVANPPPLNFLTANKSARAVEVNVTAPAFSIERRFFAGLLATEGLACAAVEPLLAPTIAGAAPSPFARPFRLHLVVEPNGTDLLPAFANESIPLQPRLLVLDRHERPIATFASPVSVTAFIDASVQANLTGTVRIDSDAFVQGHVQFTNLALSSPVDDAVLFFELEASDPATLLDPLGSATSAPVFLVQSSGFRVVPRPTPDVPDPEDPILSLGAIIGIAVGGGVLLILAGVGVAYWIRSRSQTQAPPVYTSDTNTKSPGFSVVTVPPPPRAAAPRPAPAPRRAQVPRPAATLAPAAPLDATAAPMHRLQSDSRVSFSPLVAEHPVAQPSASASAPADVVVAIRAESAVPSPAPVADPPASVENPLVHALPPSTPPRPGPKGDIEGGEGGGGEGGAGEAALGADVGLPAPESPPPPSTEILAELNKEMLMAFFTEVILPKHSQDARRPLEVDEILAQARAFVEKAWEDHGPKIWVALERKFPGSTGPYRMDMERAVHMPLHLPMMPVTFADSTVEVLLTVPSDPPPTGRSDASAGDDE